MQVRHPDYSYRGMSDPSMCPEFIADFDCRADFIDKKYERQAEKVSFLHQQQVSFAQCTPVTFACCFQEYEPLTIDLLHAMTITVERLVNFKGVSA